MNFGELGRSIILGRSIAQWLARRARVRVPPVNLPSTHQAIIITNFTQQAAYEVLVLSPNNNGPAWARFGCMADPDNLPEVTSVLL